MAKDNLLNAPIQSDADLRPIGAVVAELQHLHPEISASSLRFLERESLVEPYRSPGGHRLYSGADVQRIRQIKQWQAQRLSLAEIRSRLRIHEQVGTAPHLHETVLQLFLDGHTHEAQTALLAADDAGSIPLSHLFRDVLTPILVDVGLRWDTGDVLVSQEKEISEAIREVVVELSLRHRPRHTAGPVVIGATVQGELHELGLRMTCGVLAEAGYRVVFLGANVAPEHLTEAVARHQPDVVMLSTGSAETFPAVAASISAIAKLDLPRAPRVVVGGAGISIREQDVLDLDAIPVTSNDYEHIPQRLGAILSQSRQ